MRAIVTIQIRAIASVVMVFFLSCVGSIIPYTLLSCQSLRKYFSVRGSRKPFDDSATIGGFIAFPLVPTGFIRFVLSLERADEVDFTIPSVEDLNEVSHFLFPLRYRSLVLSLYSNYRHLQEKSLDFFEYNFMPNKIFFIFDVSLYAVSTYVEPGRSAYP